MATAPKFQLRDGSGTAQYTSFTTNQARVSLSGVVDAKTIDVQVSINGAAFVSDPTLVLLDYLTFVVPNPLSYPDGLTLEPGVNTIQVRAIDMSGGVSSPAVATITQVAAFSNAIAYIPTGIQVRRHRNFIDILIAVPAPPPVSSIAYDTPDPVFQGFNVYASATPAGATGYYRVNDKLLQASTVWSEANSLYYDNNTVWDQTSAYNVRVRVTEEDRFGNELSERLNALHNVIQYDGQLEFVGALNMIYRTQYIVFAHDRSGGPNTINVDQFADISSSDPLYYVTTAVYWDPSAQSQFETPYSQEVLGTPLIFDTTIKDMPQRTQREITVDFIAAIQRTNAEIACIPGSTTRDVSCDPFASESERLWFIANFVHRCGSFLTLLQLDDANGDGISDNPASSAYKQALKAAMGFTTDSDVQALIDTQFDNLAANCNVARLPGRPSVGQVVCYTTSKPVQDISIPSLTAVWSSANPDLGTPSVRFNVGGTYTMYAANASSYYNFNTKQWEITCDISAELSGEIGNVAAGDITSVTGVTGVQVINREATVLGTDRESNADLASRAMLGYVSVDSGTEGGYNAMCAKQIGIVKSKIVKSGDTLMMRDWDPVRQKHIGGKIDVWTQGLLERQVTDTFAFTFAIAQNIRCTIVDINTLTFRVQDSRVTPDTPIVELIYGIPGFGVRNATTGEDYIVNNSVLLDYQTFRLDTSLPQPVTHIDDIVAADYRFRSINSFVLTVQPVRRIVSVVGEASGALTPGTNYLLYKTEDPLLNGESTIAQNYVVLTQANGIPLGGTITVNDEAHVLIGFEPEPLASIGINTDTIRVFNYADRSQEFAGPGTDTPDYDILPGTPSTPVKIIRTSNTKIPNGLQVVVDYVHDENFVVTYVVNDLLQQMQTRVNKLRNITGDPLVKQAVDNSVVIETTVQLVSGAKKDSVDPAIRTAASELLDQREIGQGVAQSDVIHVVDATSGVDYEVVPLARMTYADGSQRLRETVTTAYIEMSSLNFEGNKVFLLADALENPTIDTGGAPTEHHGVFQDDIVMPMATSLALVGTVANQSWIIGAQGAIIQGWSDDATLIAEGFTTQAAIVSERLRRTANRVLVCLPISVDTPNLPTRHAYSASYIVQGDSGAHDFTSAPMEFLSLGDFTITYRNG